MPSGRWRDGEQTKNEEQKQTIFSWINEFRIQGDEDLSVHAAWDSALGSST